MRVFMASIITCSALAFLSAGCGDAKKETPAAASPDEVVLSVPGMS